MHDTTVGALDFVVANLSRFDYFTIHRDYTLCNTSYYNYNLYTISGGTICITVKGMGIICYSGSSPVPPAMGAPPLPPGSV